MSANEPHTVLLRYDLEEDREAFITDFATAFTIDCYPSDEQAIDALKAGRAVPDALVVITANTEKLANSALVKQVSSQDQCFRIVISDRLSLDQIIHLLENRVVDRCYTKPWDSNLIRTDLFAATMSVQDNARSSTISGGGPATPLVLIVDDEQSATKYLSKQLMRMQNHFDIRCAADASEALTILRQEGDRIAVLMTDQRMPGMKGLQLINEMRQTHPYITRILTSAYGELDVAMGAVNQGRIFRYQKKPWQAASLLPVLEQAITRHQTLRQEAEQSQSARTERFEDVREQRKATLVHALTDATARPVVSRELMQRFLRDMESVGTLPPGASHFRNNSPGALDNALARGLRAELTRYTDLPPTGNAAGSPTLPEPIHSALDVLLSASGLGRDSLIIEQTDDTTTLRLRPDKRLHMYSHVLSPLASASSQLLRQQGALLAIYTWVQHLGGQTQLQGDQQRFTLELSLPAHALSRSTQR